MEAVQAAKPCMTCVLPWILQISTSILSGGQATMISGITIDLCDPDYIGGEEPDKKNDKGIRELLS